MGCWLGQQAGHVRSEAHKSKFRRSGTFLNLKQSLKTFVSVLDAVRKLVVAQARRVRKNGGAADDIVRVRVEGKCDVQRYDERGCVQVAGKQPGKNDTTRSQRQLKHLFSI